MNEFGAEFINVETTLAGRSPALSVSGDVQRLALRPESSFLYFAHRRFSFGPDPSLPLVVFPDGHARRVLVFPENKTLWFAPGACLEIDPDVAVIIRGPIRADVGMIFNLPEVRDLSVQPGLALVRIESEAVEEVLVEWFGVIASSDRNEGHLGQGIQNRRAIQACFDAACRDRSRSHFSTVGPEISPPRLEIGRRLPPLTVVVRGIYDYLGTLLASAYGDEHPSLWVRGESNATWGGHGLPTFRRASQGEGEPEESAAIHVDAAVSGRWERVGIHVDFVGGEGDRPGPRDVGSAVRLVEGEATPRWRHVMMDRCSLQGGRDACLTFVDLEVIAGRAGGSAPDAPASLSRASRYVLADGTLYPKFGTVQSSRCALDAALSQDAMVEINGGLCYQDGEFYGGSGGPLPGQDEGVAYQVDLDAGLILRGTSTLVRGTSFQLVEGPRPTRWAPDQGIASLPDGQDIWVDPLDGSLGTHLTALHVDSQSWSFLGASRGTHELARGSVSLFNVGAGNVNWDAYESTYQAARQVETEGGRATLDDLQRTVLVEPPSVAWAGGSTPLLLESCLFDRYVTRLPGAGEVADVATTMFTPPVGNEPTWWIDGSVWRFDPRSSPTAPPRRRLLASVTTSLLRRPLRLTVRWETPEP